MSGLVGGGEPLADFLVMEVTDYMSCLTIVHVLVMLRESSFAMVAKRPITVHLGVNVRGGVILARMVHHLAGVVFW